MYTIEKNIPIPSRSRRGMRYPFISMVVGDSFYAPVRAATLYNSSTYFKRTRNFKDWKFRCSPEADGARIWRIK